MDKFKAWMNSPATEWDIVALFLVVVVLHVWCGAHESE